MRRRELLGMLLAGFGGAVAAQASGATRRDSPWKTAVGLNGFASSSRKYGKVYPIWEVLEFLSRSGFDGVELVQNWPMGGYPSCDETERVAALKRMYDAFGLQVFSIQIGAGGAFSPNADDRKRWLDEFRDRARFAKALGAANIGMWPGGPLRGQSIDQAITVLGDSLGQAAELAAEIGLTAAFEIEPPFVFNTEEHLQKILEQAAPSPLKTIYDPSHFDLMNGSAGRPHEMLARIGVEKIGYVHFTDTDGTLRDGGTSKHLACGDGHIDIARSLQTLLDGGFRGWLMIDAWQIHDVYDACRKGKKAFDRALA